MSASPATQDAPSDARVDDATAPPPPPPAAAADKQVTEKPKRGRPPKRSAEESKSDADKKSDDKKRRRRSSGGLLSRERVGMLAQGASLRSTAVALVQEMAADFAAKFNTELAAIVEHRKERTVTVSDVKAVVASVFAGSPRFAEELLDEISKTMQRADELVEQHEQELNKADPERAKRVAAAKAERAARLEAKKAKKSAAPADKSARAAKPKAVTPAPPPPPATKKTELKA